MSLVPSIRVDCPQCKKAFWVKLKKGTIPAVIVACPNCEYAWDLGQRSKDAIIQRSYKWDEFITKISSVFVPRAKIPVSLADESVEQFKEANTSSDSMEDWRPDLIELQVEPLELEPVELEPVEVEEIIPYSGQEVSEELGLIPSEAAAPVAEAPVSVEAEVEETSKVAADEFEDVMDAVDELDSPTQMLKPPPRPGLGSGPPKLELPKMRPLSFQKSSTPNGNEDDKSS